MPVLIRGSFLLVAAFIGFVRIQEPSRSVAIIAIVFVSILVHELGHAFTARRYGSTVAIELNGLGGLTRWSAGEEEITPGRRSLIAAAGSATGLLFGGLVWLVASGFGPYSGLLGFTIDTFVYVNVFWGLLNWLPIRPLDGGHLIQSFLDQVAPARAPMIARVIFTATAAVATVIALMKGYTFIAILAGWMLLSELAATGSGRAAPLPILSYDDDTGSTPDDEADGAADVAVDPDDAATDPDDVVVDPEEPRG